MQVTFKHSKVEKTIPVDEKMTKKDLVMVIAREFQLAPSSVKIVPIMAAKDNDLVMAKLKAGKVIPIIGTLETDKAVHEQMEVVGAKMQEDRQEEKQYASFYIDIVEKKRRIALEKEHLSNVLYASYQLGLVEWDKFSLQDARLLPMLKHAAYFGYKKRTIEILRHFLPKPIETKTWDDYVAKEHDVNWLVPNIRRAIMTVCEFAIYGCREIVIKAEEGEPQLSTLQFLQWVLLEHNYAWVYAPSEVQSAFRKKCWPDLSNLIQLASSWSNRLHVMEFLYSLLPPKTQLSDVCASSAMAYGHLRQAKWLVEHNARVTSISKALEHGCIRTLEWFFEYKKDQTLSSTFAAMSLSEEKKEQSSSQETKESYQKRLSPQRLSPKRPVRISSQDILTLIHSCLNPDQAPAILGMILPILSNSTLETACTDLTFEAHKLDSTLKHKMAMDLLEHAKTMNISMDDSKLFLRACEYSPASIVQFFFAKLPDEARPEMALAGIVAMKKRLANLVHDRDEKLYKLKPEEDDRINSRQYLAEQKLAFALEIAKNKEFNQELRLDVKCWFESQVFTIHKLLALFVSSGPKNYNWDPVKQQVGEDLLEPFQQVLMKYTM